MYSTSLNIVRLFFLKRGINEMVRVLFVCLGNICRSPMAEAVFRDMVNKEQLSDKIEVDSAGTANWHEGKPPHEGTRNKLDELGISYEGMAARQLKADDFEQFDYIITMDDSNMEDIKREFTQPKNAVVKKLLDYTKGSKEVNVPDPYYTGDFDYTYELVSNACDILLKRIKTEHNL